MSTQFDPFDPTPPENKRAKAIATGIFVVGLLAVLFWLATLYWPDLFTWI